MAETTMIKARPMGRLEYLSAAHPSAAMAIAGTLIVLLALLFNPFFADASILDDGMKSIAQNCFDGGNANLANIGVGQVAASFSELFADSDAFDVASSAAQTVTQAVGYSILAIVFLVQTVRLANRLDGNGAIPGFKDVIFLLIFFIIFKYVIDNSLAFCEAAYNGLNQITVALGGAGLTSVTLPETKNLTSALFGANSTGGAATLLLMGFFYWLLSFGVEIAAYFSVFARGLQIYVYSIFAPIPLSLLGAEETRNYGMGFIKNYIALCLTGGLIVVILMLFPPLVTSCLAINGAGDVKFVAMLGCMLLGIISLAKCGSWARDILGG